MCSSLSSGRTCSTVEVVCNDADDESKLVYDQLSVSWVSFVLNTFTSPSVWRFDPSHNSVQYLDA